MDFIITTEMGYPSRAEELKKARMWEHKNDSLMKAVLYRFDSKHSGVVQDVLNSLTMTAYAVQGDLLLGWGFRFELAHTVFTALFVKPKYRRQGIGTQLREALFPEEEDDEPMSDLEFIETHRVKLNPVIASDPKSKDGVSLLHWSAGYVTLAGNWYQNVVLEEHFAEGKTPTEALAALRKIKPPKRRKS